MKRFPRPDTKMDPETRAISNALRRVSVLLDTKPANVAARLIRMHLGETCLKCQGSGENTVGWGQTRRRCAYCNGFGNRAPRTIQEWLGAEQKAKEAAESGQLTRYTDTLKHREIESDRARARVVTQFRLARKEKPIW